MTLRTQQIELTAHAGTSEAGKAYIARINGTNREYLSTHETNVRGSGFTRKCTLAAAVVTPGVYEIASTGRIRTLKVYALILDLKEEGLVQFELTEAEATVLASSARPVSQLAPYKMPNGRWTIRNGTELCWMPEGNQEELEDLLQQRTELDARIKALRLKIAGVDNS